MNNSITTHYHNLVINEDGELIIDNNGKILVTKILDGSVEYADQVVVSQVFGIIFDRQTEDTDHEPTCELSQSESVNMSDSMSDRSESYSEINPWNRTNILKLIYSYKKHSHLFKSTRVRNEHIWNIISKETRYTSEQYKNKFKYLKSKYVKKKDNMFDKATGAKIINFEYFEEFEELFGNDANITPVVIASSSGLLTENKNDVNCNEKTNELEENRSKRSARENEDNHPKKRKVNVAEELKKLTEEIKEKEKNRERRHKEILEQRNRALTEFNKCLAFLMKKD